jgi:broad specificity phosphatase PhoE
MVILFIMRHGKTQMNKGNIIMGHLDSPLLENKERIKKLSMLLQNQKEKIKEIYSSDLGRAHNTAKKILAELNQPIKINLNEQLREINYGDASNKLKTDVEKKFPLHKKEASFKYPNGESFDELHSRIESFLNKIKNSEETFLIVTHAGCIRAIISYMKNETMQNNLKLKISHDILLKCTINKKIKKLEIINE